MWWKWKRLQAAVPVVHRVGVIRERLRGRYVDVGPVWFGSWGRGGGGMMEWGHWGATGGRHWAGGLHSCRLLLLIGTKATEGKKGSKTCAVPQGWELLSWWCGYCIFDLKSFVLYFTSSGTQIHPHSFCCCGFFCQNKPATAVNPFL